MAAIQQILMAVGTSVSLPASLTAVAFGERFQDFLGASAFARVTLGSAGILTLEYNANGDFQTPPFPVEENYTWLVGGNSSVFSARMRKTSGSSFTAGSAAIETWLPITSDLAWTLISNARGGGGFDADALTAVLEIAYTNNLTNILAQCNISMETTAVSTGSGNDLR
jgi:hypothetical protein